MEGDGKNKQHPAWLLDTIQRDPRNYNRLDHPTEQEVRNVLSRLISYRKRCMREKQEPDYEKFLLEGDPIGGGGPKPNLDPVLEAFIQANVGLTAKPCFEKALEDDECKQLLEEGDQEARNTLKQRFLTRVGNIRCAAGGGGGGGGGRKTGLDPVLEAFIQANGGLTAKPCFEKALEDLECKQLLEEGDQEARNMLKQRFLKRVGNIRGAKRNG